MHIVPEDANEIPVRVCLGFSRVVSGGRSKNPGNPRLFEHRSRPRVPCDRKLGPERPLMTGRNALAMWLEGFYRAFSARHNWEKSAETAA
jgi:hypothetical protein